MFLMSPRVIFVMFLECLSFKKHFYLIMHTRTRMYVILRESDYRYAFLLVLFPVPV